MARMGLVLRSLIAALCLWLACRSNAPGRGAAADLGQSDGAVGQRT